MMSALVRSILGFGTSIAIARILNIEQVSIYYLSIAVGGLILAALDFGISQSIIYAEPENEHNVASVALGYSLIQALAFSVATALLFVLSFKSGATDYFLFYAISCAFAAVAAPTNILRAMRERKLDAKFLALLDLISLGVATVAACALIFIDELSKRNGVLRVAIIYLAPQIVSAVVLLALSGSIGSIVKFDSKKVILLAKKGKYFALNNFVFLAFQQMDLFVAVRILNPSEAGFYALAKTIAGQLGNIAYLGAAKITAPRLAKAHRDTGIGVKDRESYLKFYGFCAIAFFLIGGAFSSAYLNIAYGEKWDPSAPVLLVLLGATSIRFFSIPNASHVIAVKGAKIILIDNLFGLLLLAIFGILAALMFGKIYLALAVVFASTCVAGAQYVQAKSLIK